MLIFKNCHFYAPYLKSRQIESSKRRPRGGAMKPGWSSALENALFPENSHDKRHFILYKKFEFYSRTKVAQNIIVCSLGGFAVEMGGSGGFVAFVDAQLGTSKVKRPPCYFFSLATYIRGHLLAEL